MHIYAEMVAEYESPRLLRELGKGTAFSGNQALFRTPFTPAKPALPDAGFPAPGSIHAPG